MYFEDIESLAKSCSVFDLGVEMFPGMPHVPLHAPYSCSLIREHGDAMFEDGACASVDVFFCSGHTGTHIDAICHISKDMQLYNGVDATKVQNKINGFSEYGIETVAPICRRGVLIDVARHFDKEILEPGRAIGRDDLLKASASQGTKIKSGDVVLIRTGHMQIWPNKEFYTQRGGVPGINLDAARWLSDQGIAMVGSDNFGVEVMPNPSIPVHCHMLVDHGIHLIEILMLEELSQTRTYEFLFVCLPLKLRGGTGSPVRPVAIV